MKSPKVSWQPECAINLQDKHIGSGKHGDGGWCCKVFTASNLRNAAKQAYRYMIRNGINSKGMTKEKNGCDWCEIWTLGY